MPYLNSAESGKGPAILLLHGFPFNQSIWDNFRKGLSEKFHVVTVDLPGLGKSPIENPASFSIDVAAKTILKWVKERKLSDICLVGHSLGGYVALSMVHQQPELFSGLILFHSTAYPDNEERKQSRNKVLEFIQKNGVLAFTSNFIVPLFANPHDPHISDIKEIASQATEEGVILYTKAMRDREDRTAVLRDFPNPILFISGEKDQGISPESVRKQSQLNQHSSVQILPDIAHMGMFENAKVTTQLISDFAGKVTGTSKK
jgi:pimeloyl-ACP methyl ester carboxylesterase